METFPEGFLRPLPPFIPCVPADFFISFAFGRSNFFSAAPIATAWDGVTSLGPVFSSRSAIASECVPAARFWLLILPESGHTCRQQNRNVLELLTPCCVARLEGSVPPFFVARGIGTGRCLISWSPSGRA